METNKIYQGDCLEVLKTFPDKSINMSMTSPPYWALRDYGVDGQLGLESTFDEYINKLCNIFDEVKRVLRDDGTCWVNIGDTYYGSGKGAGGDLEKSKESYQMPEDWKRPSRDNYNKMSTSKNCLYCNKEIKKGVTSQFCNHTCLNKMGNDFRSQNRQLPDKCLTMIPMRFATEMVNRGWILRNTIIWHKPNAMPSSAKDRFTVDFEYIFLFSKKKKYYFETQYEPMITNDISSPRGSKGVLGSLNSGRRVPYSVQPREKEFVEYRNLPDIKDFSKYISDKRKELGITVDEVEEYFRNQAPHHWFNAESFPSSLDYMKLKTLIELDDRYTKSMTEVFTKSSEKTSSPKGRNKRTTWTICPKPFKEAHFAVYPEELCETPIKAGCPEGGIVLDPFTGAGTTSLVALKQNKRFIGIELNKEYIEIAEKRLKPFIEQQTLDYSQTHRKTTE